MSLAKQVLNKISEANKPTETEVGYCVYSSKTNNAYDGPFLNEQVAKSEMKSLGEDDAVIGYGNIDKQGNFHEVKK